MTDEVKKNANEVVVDPQHPDKVTLVIDPISKPLEFAKDVGKAIGKAGKKTGKAIKGIFK